MTQRTWEASDDEAPDPPALADEVARAMYRVDGAARPLGIHIEHIAPGSARLSMKLRPEMLNSHQTGHGGFLFALADTAFAYASNARNLATVASGCSIDYVAPAHLGDTLTAVADELALSGRTGVYDVTITNQKGEVIAFFRGKSYRIRGTAMPAEKSHQSTTPGEIQA